MTKLDLSLLTTLDPDRLPDEQLRPMLRALLNIVEALLAEVQALKAENQELRDEINRLKGEQGKPSFKAKRVSVAPANYSSERERREPRAWQKGTKLDQIRIDRVEQLTVDPATLPADAVRKGTEAVVVQDLVLRTDNVRFEREVWYSPGLRKSYRAALPPGYDDGEFGPGIKPLALALAYGANVSEGKLLELFRQAGAVVSAGWLAGLLSGVPGGLAAEAQAVERAGLESSPWQHSDTTGTQVSTTVSMNAGTRVDTESWHCHTLGNPLFTVYRTLPTKSRLAVLTLLRGGEPLTYLWNAVADAHPSTALRAGSGLAEAVSHGATTAERGAAGPGAERGGADQAAGAVEPLGELPAAHLVPRGAGSGCLSGPDKLAGGPDAAV
jgi:hypothetical protein